MGFAIRGGVIVVRKLALAGLLATAQADAGVFIEASASSCIQPGPSFTCASADYTNVNGLTILAGDPNWHLASGSPALAGSFSGSASVMSGPAAAPSSGLGGTAFSQADLASGILRGSSWGSPANSDVGSYGELNDTAILNNTTGGPVGITVNWFVHGTGSEPAGSFFSLRTFFFLGSGGLWYEVFPGASAPAASGWDSFTISPLGSGGRDGVDFMGTLILPVGISHLPFRAILDLDCDFGASCDFANTATFSLGLPSGVSLGSESGVLLTAEPAEVPEPASLGAVAGMLALCGIVRASRRRRSGR